MGKSYRIPMFLLHTDESKINDYIVGGNAGEADKCDQDDDSPVAVGQQRHGDNDTRYHFSMPRLEMHRIIHAN